MNSPPWPFQLEINSELTLTPLPYPFSASSLTLRAINFVTRTCLSLNPLVTPGVQPLTRSSLELRYPTLLPYTLPEHPATATLQFTTRHHSNRFIMPGAEGQPQTLYDKVLQAHIVDEKLDGTVLLYIGWFPLGDARDPRAAKF